MKSKEPMAKSVTQHPALGTQHCSRILVRATNWIGDAVMAEPAISALRAAYPTANITMLARPAIADLFRAHPWIDQVIVYEHRGRHAGWAGKWRLASELRRRNLDLAILFQNAFEAALLTMLAGIPRRYGYATDGRRWLLTDAVPLDPATLREHQTRYYLDLLRPLGIDRPATAPRLFVTPEEDEAAGKRLRDAGVADRDIILGLNPGSTYGSAKRWLPERFAETVDRLARTFGARIVIVGAPGEESLGESIAARMHSAPAVLSGRTSIRELMAVIKRCHLFLTNDTGPMHIAAAFGVPVVAVFGPTDARTTAPFGDQHTMVRRPVECSPCLLRACPIDHRCMTRITVEDVYNVASEKLRMLNVECSSASTLHASRSLKQTTQHSPLSTHDSLKGVTVFLDRDGTVNRDTGYIKTPEELELLPGVPEAIARLNEAGARVVLITNQSGIARGLFTVATLRAIHARLLDLLEPHGARVDAIFYCPHHPDDGCTCRKPQPGMIERAATDLGIDVTTAYMIGDQRRDVELARRVGARAVLVTSGPIGVETVADLQRDGIHPDHVAAGLGAAVEWILEDAKNRYSFTVNR